MGRKPLWVEQSKCSTVMIIVSVSNMVARAQLQGHNSKIYFKKTMKYTQKGAQIVSIHSLIHLNKPTALS